MNRLLAHPLFQRRRLVSRAAVATLLAGFALTATLFGVARALEAYSARADFEQHAAVRTAAVTGAFAASSANGSLASVPIASCRTPLR